MIPNHVIPHLADALEAELAKWTLMDVIEQLGHAHH
jgi:hypothetical protein